MIFKKKSSEEKADLERRRKALREAVVMQDKRRQEYKATMKQAAEEAKRSGSAFLELKYHEDGDWYEFLYLDE